MRLFRELKLYLRTDTFDGPSLTGEVPSPSLGESHQYLRPEGSLSKTRPEPGESCTVWGVPSKAPDVSLSEAAKSPATVVSTFSLGSQSVMYVRISELIISAIAVTS
ncbi:hypothetical protein Leryth_025606 [Lithospermum erythrorhizon]|nr:hypothetical protein Leryth_025606 [Lithospermum erythrorhizon]